MRSYKGTIKAIFKQSFQGLLQGYLVQIQLIGVGFRVEQSSHEVPLDFKLGFSHPVFYKLPADIRAIISKPTELLGSTREPRAPGSVLKISSCRYSVAVQA